MSKWPLVVTTTAARVDALRRLLEPNYLGHSDRDEKVRELLADLDRAVEDQRTTASSHSAARDR